MLPAYCRLPASHESAVEEDHEVVTHDTIARDEDEDRSGSPKLSPVTVTDARPDCGALDEVNDSTGESNVSPPFKVPTIPATDSLAISSTGMPLLPGDARQVRAVAETQELHAHTTYPS